MIRLRMIEATDIDLLYEWANDSLVRDNSFSSKSISFKEHKAWFSRMLRDPSVYQYIMVNNDSPVGQIRLNIKGDQAEIGYSIAKDYRGQGYGHIILRLIKDEVNANHPEIKTLIARVKPNNSVSKKLFEDEGYEKTYISYSLKTNQL